MHTLDVWCCKRVSVITKMLGRMGVGDRCLIWFWRESPSLAAFFSLCSRARAGGVAVLEGYQSLSMMVLVLGTGVSQVVGRWYHTLSYSLGMVLVLIKTLYPTLSPMA